MIVEKKEKTVYEYTVTLSEEEATKLRDYLKPKTYDPIAFKLCELLTRMFLPGSTDNE